MLVCITCKGLLLLYRPIMCMLVCRFTFKLSPGQEDEAGLQLQSSFTLGPKEGIFVVPVLRTEE